MSCILCYCGGHITILAHVPGVHDVVAPCCVGPPYAHAYVRQGTDVQHRGTADAQGLNSFPEPSQCPPLDPPCAAIAVESCESAVLALCD